jgi:3-oxoadipate enol-lactonase
MPYLSANGIRLYYQTAGEGPPLLLLHGLGSASDDWQLQIPIFAGQFRVVAMDLRGHGHSDKPRGPYSMRDFASDAVVLLDGLAIPRAHVLGLSLGGMVAQQLALDYPHRVSSLILVNTFPRFDPWEPRLLRRIVQRVINFGEGGMEAVAEAVAASLFPRPTQRPLYEETVKRFARNDRGGYQASVQAILRFNVESRLREVRCPTLIVAGDRDRTVSWRQKVSIARRVAEARLAVIHDSGHASPLDQPAHFNRVVLEFLGKQENR